MQISEFSFQKEGKLQIIFTSKKFIIFCSLLLIFFCSAAHSETSPEKKFGLKISGGISNLSGTDYDPSDWGWDFLRKVTMENQGGTYAWEQNVLDWGWEITGELVFNLSSRFDIAGGVGYITGKSHSKGTTTLAGVTTINETNLKAKAIPVTLTLYYFLPVSSKSRFSLGAGVGYYFASFTRNYLHEQVGIYWIDADFMGSASDVGFHGGIGFEYDLSEAVAIVIEGLGRYAKVSGFEGTRERIDSNNWSDSWEGKFYYSDRQHSSGTLLPRVNLSDPSSIENAINARDYETDFSGFTIRIGLKIKLF